MIPVTSVRSRVQVTAFSGEPFGVADITLTTTISSTFFLKTMLDIGFRKQRTSQNISETTLSVRLLPNNKLAG
jgi:hypothetical protein